MSYIMYFQLHELLKEFDLLFASESNRGAAVVAACFIEDSVAEISDMYDGRPMVLPERKDPPAEGTFAFQLENLRRMAVLEVSEIKDFQLVRAVRNKFAHVFRAAAFDYPGVRELLERHAGQGGVPSSLTDYFVVVVRNCLNSITRLKSQCYDDQRRAQYEENWKRRAGEE
jgi:hypothetical protein